MNHEMKLFPEPFEQIRSGRKTIEIRLNDEKRQKVNVGDTITFRNTDSEMEMQTVEVLELIHFSTFKELYESRSNEAFGFGGETIEWMLKETYRIYTPERERKYGALGIRLSVISGY